MSKILIGVNLTHKRYGLERIKFTNHAALTAVIHNIRRLLHELGYDSSLLDDSEVMALEELVADSEYSGENGHLIDVLNFISYTK